MLKAALLTLILSAALSPTAHCDEFPDWYGTFTVDQEFHTSSTEVYKKGDAYYPGVRTITHDKTWSGTIVYLPGKRRITTGSFYEHDLDLRKSSYQTTCTMGNGAEYHDYETHEKTISNDTPTESKATFGVYIGDDGKYGVHTTWNIRGTKTSEADYTMREMFEGCRKPPVLNRTEHRHSSTGTDSGVTLDAKDNAGTLPPQVLEGQRDVPEKDGLILKFSWKLTRAVPKIVAIIKAPGFFKRGDTVTLDASGSYGDITEYSWRFDLGENCAPAMPANPMLELKGPKHSFRALCDFRAHLTIKDSTGAGDHATAALKVQARDGEEWKAHFRHQAGKPLAQRLLSMQLLFGVNRCANTMHGDDADANDHLIHSDSKNLTTWLGSGYEVEQLGEDNGPFSGLWFVSSQKLEINRDERVSASLTTGEVHALNVQNNNASAVQALAAQVKQHEEIHSALVSEAFSALGDEGNPGHTVEAVLASTQDVLQTFADMKVREAETVLREANAEDKVKARMQGQAALRGPVSIWVPTYNGPAVKKDLGPLWSIGE